MTSRRGFLKGIAALAVAGTAPALIREGFAMPVKPELGALRCIENNAWKYGIDNGGHGILEGDWVLDADTPWADELIHRGEFLGEFYTRAHHRKNPELHVSDGFFQRQVSIAPALYMDLPLDDVDRRHLHEASQHFALHRSLHDYYQKHADIKVELLQGVSQ